MPKSVKLYKNEEKKKQYLKRNRDRYYRKNYENCYRARKAWTEAEIELILYSPMSDLEISKEIHRSLRAIQVKRHRLMKEI